MSGVGFICALQANMISSQVQQSIEIGSAALEKILAMKKEQNPIRKRILRHEYELIMMRFQMLDVTAETNRKMIAALCGVESD